MFVEPEIVTGPSARSIVFPAASEWSRVNDTLLTLGALESWPKSGEMRGWLETHVLPMLGWAISKERKPVAPPVNVAVVAPGAFANPTSTDLATIADPVFASYDNIATRAQLDSAPALAPEEFFDSLPDMSPAPAAMA